MISKIIANTENAHYRSPDKCECGPHLNRAEVDGRHAVKRASGMQRRNGIAASPGKAYGTNRQLSENAWFVCLLTIIGRNTAYQFSLRFSILPLKPFCHFSSSKITPSL